jgi:O-antigen ligase
MRLVVPAMPRTVRWILVPLIFSAFLTQIKLVPGIGTNIGPFELFSGLLLAVFALHPTSHQGARLHPISRILLAIAIWAAISQINIRPENTRTGIIQTLIVINLFLVVTVLYNLARRYRISPQTVLTIVVYSLLVVGPWVIASGVRSGGDIQASGPFRNRAHMATYMLTAFWLVVIYILLPGLRRVNRYAGYVAAALCLYAVAVSGRRSVYLALFVGLASLVGLFILAKRGKRTRTLMAAGFAVAFLALFYTYGGVLFSQASFFQSRVGSVGERLKAFVSPSEAAGAEGNFYALQRQGVMMAFRDNPILGIGWGGFVQSAYSPTGHEVHSTPLRFLAELGLPGLLLYLTFLGTLLVESARLFRRMRDTPYSASYLTLAVSTWSLAVSNVYNRHITERTFWLFLIVLLTMHVFSETFGFALRRRAALRGPQGGGAVRAGKPGPAPTLPAAAQPAWSPRTSGGARYRSAAQEPQQP